MTVRIHPSLYSTLFMKPLLPNVKPSDRQKKTDQNGRIRLLQKRKTLTTSMLDRPLQNISHIASLKLLARTFNQLKNLQLEGKGVNTC